MSEKQCIACFKNLMDEKQSVLGLPNIMFCDNYRCVRRGLITVVSTYSADAEGVQTTVQSSGESTATTES